MSGAGLALVVALCAAAIIAVIVVTFRIAIAENSKVLARIRESLKGVRLFRMLERRHVDIRTYVQNTDVSEIRQQIAKCETCPSSPQCDAALNSAEEPEDYSFCPNDPAIERAVQENPEKQDTSKSQSCSA